MLTAIRLLATLTGYVVWLLLLLGALGAGDFSLIFTAK
jgi:hypothetical protein